MQLAVRFGGRRCVVRGTEVACQLGTVCGGQQSCWEEKLKRMRQSLVSSVHDSWLLGSTGEGLDSGQKPWETSRRVCLKGPKK